MGLETELPYPFSVKIINISFVINIDNNCQRLKCDIMANKKTLDTVRHTSRKYDLPFQFPVSFSVLKKLIC